MLSRKLIGISIAPDSVSIVSVAVGVRSLGSPVIWSASLGAGCIDPTTGVLESSESLRDHLRSAPPALGLTASSSKIALVLPQQLFLTETWSVGAPLQGVDSRSIRDEAVRRLPGDRTMLQFDCVVSPRSGDSGAASAMVVAIRRAHLVRFADALSGCAIHPESVVSSDVARFNLLCLVHPASSRGRVLCVSARASAVECELWKNGVLEWKQQEVFDRGSELCAAHNSELGMLASGIERSRGGRSLECLGVFGDARYSRTIARVLFGQGDEDISRGAPICPMEQAFGINDAAFHGCLDEAAGAIAPYVSGRSIKLSGEVGASLC